MRLAIFFLTCALGWMFPAWSQTKSGDEAKGASTVFGHVYCADTNAPARMALVVLQPAAALDHYEPGSTRHVTTHAEAVQTLVDGSYLIQHVAPGTYYVIATAPGYLSPTALFSADLDETSASKEVLKKRIADSLPRVTVRPNSTVSVNTTLERGAAVSGTITYDDGSPASGLFVQVLTRRKDQWVPLQFTPFDRTTTSVQTDDRGSYRISGLPAREYILEVQLNVSRLSYRSDGNGSGASSSQYASISTYSGGKTRSKTAVPFVLGSAEERRGEDIEIPASKFHTLRGKHRIRSRWPCGERRRALAALC